jgi:hypothetical protein
MSKEPRTWLTVILVQRAATVLLSAKMVQESATV